jgi:hypothetical protein
MRGLRQANVILAVYELDSVIVVYRGGSTIQFSYLRDSRKKPTVIRHLLVRSLTPEDVQVIP